MDYLKYIDYEFLQDDSFLKVTTDTVCLGMFLDKLTNKTVLDIGTNTGSLLLYAHYHKAKTLIGVDIHKDALKLAEKNLSKYTENFKLYCQKVQKLEINPVDVIICNPPFFETGKEEKKNKYLQEALFDKNLSLEDLFKSFKKLLKLNGEIYLIYKADRFAQVFEKCKEYNFKIMKLQFIYDKNTEFATRCMLKLKVGKGNKFNILKPVIL